MRSDVNGIQVRGLSIKFGAAQVLRDLSFAVPPGASVALVGNHGSGKTSALCAISGASDLGADTSGEVAFGDEWMPVSAIKSRDRLASLVPERAKVFPTLSVEDNLRAVMPAGGRIRVNDIFGWFPRLKERHKTLAGNLSGGEQQMLGIGLALLGSPKVLLLDEPTLGLAIPVVEQLCETLAKLRRELAMPMIVAEASIQWLNALASEAVVVDRGVVVATIKDLRHDDQIKRLLLGTEV